jgi:hypothetical protein
MLIIIDFIIDYYYWLSLLIHSLMPLLYIIDIITLLRHYADITLILITPLIFDYVPLLIITPHYATLINIAITHYLHWLFHYAADIFIIDYYFITLFSIIFIIDAYYYWHYWLMIYAYIISPLMILLHYWHWLTLTLIIH